MKKAAPRNSRLPFAKVPIISCQFAPRNEKYNRITASRTVNTVAQRRRPLLVFCGRSAVMLVEVIAESLDSLNSIVPDRDFPGTSQPSDESHPRRYGAAASP